jgi:hypothetical protein
MFGFSSSEAKDQRTGAGDYSQVVGAGGVFAPFAYQAPFNIGAGSAATGALPENPSPLTEASKKIPAWIWLAAIAVAIVAGPLLLKKLKG